MTFQRWWKWTRLSAGIASLGLWYGCSSLLYYPSSQQYYAPAQFGFQEKEVWLKTPTSGQSLYGWFFSARKEQTSSGRPRGVVVLFHGNGENLSSHFLNLVWMVDFGYSVFIFDYPGYGRSEGDPTPRNTVEAGHAALRWVHDQNPELPVTVVGQSLGGAVAARVVADLAGEIPIQLLVIDSSFASYRAIGKHVLARSAWTWLLRWLPSLLLTDSDAPQGSLGQISPTPTVVIHGDADGVVEFELGQEVYAQLKEPKVFWRVAGGGHTEAFTRFRSVYGPRLLRVLAALEKGRKWDPTF